MSDVQYIGAEITNEPMCSTRRERLYMCRCVVFRGREQNWADAQYIVGVIINGPKCSTRGKGQNLADVQYKEREIINGPMCSTQKEKLEMGRCVVHRGRDYKWADVSYKGGDQKWADMQYTEGEVINGSMCSNQTEFRNGPIPITQGERLEMG